MKYAINIALIPDQVMYDKTIVLSKQLAAKDPRYCLGPDKVPHITLVHCIIDEQDLEQVYEAIQQITQQTQTFQLEVSKTSTGPNSGTCHLSITPTKKLQHLHEHVIETLKPLFHDKADSSMFVDADEITIETQWAERFLETSAFEKYNPHFTVGFGELNIQTPIPFTAPTIGIYQIGKTGSCAKELKSFSLQ